MLIVASQLPIGTRLEKWFCATYAREQKVERWREGSKVKRCKEGLFEGELVGSRLACTAAWPEYKS